MGGAREIKLKPFYFTEFLGHNEPEPARHRSDGPTLEQERRQDHYKCDIEIDLTVGKAGRQRHDR